MFICHEAHCLFLSILGRKPIILLLAFFVKKNSPKIPREMSFHELCDRLRKQFNSLIFLSFSFIGVLLNYLILLEIVLKITLDLKKKC